MTTPVIPLILIGVLTTSGVYVLLERGLVRMLLGFLLIGNAINLLIVTVAGSSGNPPIRGRTSAGRTTTADPLAQAMVLTAIVITMGIAAFVLAMAYRSYRLTTAEEVPRDPEDTRVSRQKEDEAVEDVVHPEPERREDEPAELDALPASTKGPVSTPSRRPT
jgi:multicomponent Na+:H+ antiporter subunit C